jgi:hypothetical protein
MNRATKTIAATMGILLGVSGLDHGFFEVLQGSTPTGGLFIQAIGPQHQWWKYGGEEAFTIVPNFLITGILVILIGIAMIVWSVRWLHRANGLRGFSILAVLLFLLGGGIAAPVVFFPAGLAVASRINKPLTWWRRILPAGLRRVLAKIWPYTLAAQVISFAIGLAIAIFGWVPGVSDPEQILAICWAFVFGGGLGLFLVSAVAGFAADIEVMVASEKES